MRKMYVHKKKKNQKKTHININNCPKNGIKYTHRI